MADENLDQRLAAIEAAIPPLATKADLEAALDARFARLNASIDREFAQMRSEVAALRTDLTKVHDDVGVLTAMATRQDHQISGLRVELRTYHDRLRQLENPAPEG